MCADIRRAHSTAAPMPPPLIGITTDLQDDAYRVPTRCPAAVSEAGGVPVLLPCLPRLAGQILQWCDGLILSGGDDPIMERFNVATHPKAKPIAPRRQAFELSLLAALDDRPDLPVLGICLGMQLMGLHHGATLDQYLPDTLSTAAEHWPQREHPVRGVLGSGVVSSHHRQALRVGGNLQIVARASDGVIEAIADDRRCFYLGVQWHPERTEDRPLGIDLIRRLVAAAQVHAQGANVPLHV